MITFTAVIIFKFICSLNSVGHGGTDGLHAYVHSLDDAVVDLVCFKVQLQKCI